MIYLVLIESYLALAVFGAAALTDLFDGMLARKANKVTEFGRLMDPLADRLFISSIAVALYIRSSIPPLSALGILLARDLVILSGGILLQAKGLKIDVSYLGKVATAVLLCSILLLVANVAFGLWIFYFGLLLYLVSGFDYLARGKKLIVS